MNLEKWVEHGWLKREPTSSGEIKDLLGILEHSLSDSKVEAVSTGLRFIAAFNAALCSATIALRASSHHSLSDSKVEARSPSLVSEATAKEKLVASSESAAVASDTTLGLPGINPGRTRAIGWLNPALKSVGSATWRNTSDHITNDHANLQPSEMGVDVTTTTK